MSRGAQRVNRFTFPLGEEQKLVAEAARDFAARRLAPGAAERDRTGKFPLEHVQELAGLGLLAMKVPVEDGGSGTDNVGYVLAMERSPRRAPRPRSSSPRATSPRRS